MKKCGFCAEEIQDTAIVCKHCGRDLVVATPAPPTHRPLKPRKRVRRSSWIAAGMIGGLALLALYLGKSAEIQPNADLAGSRVPYDVTAVDLFDAYERNEVAADGQYGGQLLSIHGRIKEIGKDIRGTAYLTMGSNLDNPKGVQAMFREGDGGQLSQLSKGDSVTVVCEGDRKLTMWVYVRNCQLLR